jgi:hypothetical protein
MENYGLTKDMLTMLDPTI